jgi:excisionase family DNA binding protein
MRDLVAPGAGNPEKFYTLGEVAILLNVSRTTVYRWRLRGLGVVRISGVVRIGESSLRQFIAHHYTQGEQTVGA